MGGKPRTSAKVATLQRTRNTHDARAMNRVVAFLRGMNLGRRRITNDDLCASFVSMGFVNVTAFLASGNVIFETDRPASECDDYIAAGLRKSLSYEVPTFVRCADEVRHIAAYHPFPVEVIERSGKLQVMLLASPPSRTAHNQVLALATEEDRLAIHGRELYWLPAGTMSDSELDLKAIDSALGPMTVRTRRTIERIAAKYFEPLCSPETPAKSSG